MSRPDPASESTNHKHLDSTPATFEGALASGSTKDSASSSRMARPVTLSGVALNKLPAQVSTLNATVSSNENTGNGSKSASSISHLSAVYQELSKLHYKAFARDVRNNWHVDYASQDFNPYNDDFFFQDNNLPDQYQQNIAQADPEALRLWQKTKSDVQSQGQSAISGYGGFSGGNRTLNPDFVKFLLRRPE